MKLDIMTKQQTVFETNMPRYKNVVEKHDSNNLKEQK